MRILFMGTPEFASESLKKLYEENFDICGVFTQPDKPKNRGMKLTASPVKELALAHGTQVFQPEKMRTGEAMNIVKKLEPEIIVVVAYGKILPKDILEYPKYGCINLHGSLLPKYRGAAPIQWSVINGEKYGGVTTMYMAEELDAGDMIMSQSTEIGEYETAGELYGRLSRIGAELLVETLRNIENGSAERTVQNGADATYAPQLSKEMSLIDWSDGSRIIINKICGLNPWPVAAAEFSGTRFKIYGAVYGNKTVAAPGSIVSQGKNGLEIACGDGRTIFITELQAAGGKRMQAADYLRGHKI